MSWRDKLDTIEQLSEHSLTLAMFSGLAAPAPAAFLDRLLNRWPFASSSYIEFLQRTDGAQLDLFIMYGSGLSQFPPLFDENDSKRAFIDTGSNIALAEDALGETFLLSKQGSVSVVGNDPPGNPQIVAANFDDLLDQVFMGPRYSDYFRSPGKHSDWLEFMREQQWI